MNISQTEFQFMVESITTDLIVMLIKHRGYTTEQAVDAVYGSYIYKSLLNPLTALYYKSSGHIYGYLEEELDGQLHLL